MRAEEGVVSGEKGCEVKHKNFTLTPWIPYDSKCTVKWEPTNICPDQTEKMPEFHIITFPYYDAPPSIACTKITELSCKYKDYSGTEKICKKENINVPIPNLWFYGC